MDTATKQKFKKILLWAFAAGFYWLSLSIATDWEHKSTLEKIGYCEPLGRILTDDEKIKAAIDYINNESIFVNGQEVEVIKYKNADEVLQKNPDCCILTKGNGWDFSGWDTAQVFFDVRYKINGELRTIRFGSNSSAIPDEWDSRSKEVGSAMEFEGRAFVDTCGKVVTSFH